MNGSLALCAAKIADLQSALDQPDTRVEAIEVLRTLVERIVLISAGKCPNRPRPSQKPRETTRRKIGTSRNTPIPFPHRPITVYSAAR